MKKIFIVLLFCLTLSGCSQNVLAENECSLESKVNVSVFKNNDYKVSNYICSSVEGNVLKNYIESNRSKIFVNEYYDFSAKEDPKLLAVSLYKSKNNKTPVLITLHSSYHCCTPQLEGNIYKVNLYQMNKINNDIKLKDITQILGDHSEGFEGLSEGRVFYKFKNIASIKKWLDKNYK